jgi:hypothetical protein
VVAFNSRIFTFRNLHIYEYTEKYSRCRSIGRRQNLPSAYWRPYTVRLARNLYVQMSVFLSFHWNSKANSCFSLGLPLAYFVLFQVSENKSCTDENSSRANFWRLLACLDKTPHTTPSNPSGGRLQVTRRGCLLQVIPGARAETE